MPARSPPRRAAPWTSARSEPVLAHLVADGGGEALEELPADAQPEPLDVGVGAEQGRRHEALAVTLGRVGEQRLVAADVAVRLRAQDLVG